MFVNSYGAYIAVRAGIRMRKIMTGILFRKMLRLSTPSVAQASAGQLLNIVSGDMVLL